MAKNHPAKYGLAMYTLVEGMFRVDYAHEKSLDNNCFEFITRTNWREMGSLAKFEAGETTQQVKVHPLMAQLK